MQSKKVLIALAIALMFWAGAAQAQETQVIFDPNNTTKAIGIENLNVNGNLYNVDFVHSLADQVYGEFEGTFDFPDRVLSGAAVDAAAVELTLAGAMTVGEEGGAFSLIYRVGFNSFVFIVEAVEIWEGVTGDNESDWIKNPATDAIAYYAEDTMWADFTPVGGELEGDLSYVPVTPCTIVDTRNSGGIISDGQERNFNVFGDAATIGGQGGNEDGCSSPGGEPLAAHINMVAVEPTAQGNLKAYPLGAGSGEGLSVNYNNTIGTNLANAGTVGAVTGDGADITVASNYAGAHTVITVLGYYYRTADLLYTPVTPCTIVDTRNTSDGSIAASEERDFHVFGNAATISDQGGNEAGCASPGAGEPLAAHINMVAVEPTAKGNLKAYPLGAGSGEGLSVNYNNTIGTNLANAGTVGAVTGDGADITVASNYAGAHTVITVLGYYYRTADLLYTPVTPCTIVDTRNTSDGSIAASEERDFHVFGNAATISDQGGNEAGCASPGAGEPLAAHINMVAVEPTAKGNLKAYPLGAGTGEGLSVNYNNTIGTNLANAGTVGTATGDGADITVASNFAGAHTVITVLGYYYGAVEPPSQPPPGGNEDAIEQWCSIDACEESPQLKQDCIETVSACLEVASTQPDVEGCLGAGFLICWEVQGGLF